MQQDLPHQRAGKTGARQQGRARFKMSRRVRLAVEGVVLGFLVWAVAGTLMHATSVSEVAIHLAPGGEEHADKSVLGVGQDDVAPDYRLRARTPDGWIELGTYANTWIGEGLRFAPNSDLPAASVIEFQLLDDDKIEDDVLEQFPYDGDSYSGVNYSFEIATVFSAESGFSWFFQTPVGMAVLGGIAIGVLFIVLACLPPPF